MIYNINHNGNLSSQYIKKLNIDDRLIKATFKRHGSSTPELMRLYYLCNQSFSHKSGVFTLSELADILYLYGYKSLGKNQGGNREKKKRELRELLLSAPELFTMTKQDVFKVHGKRKANPRKKSFRKKFLREIDFNLLHKKNKREFYDLIIGIPGDGRTTDYKEMSERTGFTKARICQAAEANHSKGYICKVNNEISIACYANKDTARIERLKFYKDNKIITHLRKLGKFYHIVVNGANSYTSIIMLNPKDANPQPMFKRSHESTVFDVIAVNNFRAICKFKDHESMINYFWRRSEC